MNASETMQGMSFEPAAASVAIGKRLVREGDYLLRVKSVEPSTENDRDPAVRCEIMGEVLFNSRPKINEKTLPIGETFNVFRITEPRMSQDGTRDYAETEFQDWLLFVTACGVDVRTKYQSSQLVGALIVARVGRTKGAKVWNAIERGTYERA